MAEAVSIVLAIAPLIISAFEDYKHIARSFKAFKHFSLKVGLNRRVLDVQAWIFRKEIERLLSYCVDDEDLAQRMLADRNDPNWQDPQIASLYLERLGDSRIVFQHSIELISHELSFIRNTLAEFKPLADTRSRTIRKRIRYVLKESDIEKALGVLKKNTQDLTAVVDLSIPQELRPDIPGRNFAAQRELGRFSRVQETAEDLYRALGHACAKHTYHEAHLSLEPVCSDARQIRFAIAFSQLNLACSSNRSANSTWLTVESRISDRIESVGGERSLTEMQAVFEQDFGGNGCLTDSKGKTVIKQSSVKETKVNVKVEKRTRFQDPEELMNVATAGKKQPPPLVNICTNSNFCDQLRRFINQSQPTDNAVGFLNLSGESKHLVYIDLKSQIVAHSPNKSSSLSLTTLQDIYAQSSAGFTMPQRFSLARQLAKALLQFHTTPWLRNSWDSRAVLVPIITNDEEGNADSRAFITAKISGPNNQSGHVELPPSPIVIRNWLIFSLGVILLEIAFQKPLQELATEEDRDRSHPEFTDYLTAQRLSRLVSVHMGFAYAEVTRKCIQCDFGHGSDLRKAELREGFYRDVVCQLVKVERRGNGW